METLLGLGMIIAVGYAFAFYKVERRAYEEASIIEKLIIVFAGFTTVTITFAIVVALFAKLAS